MGYHGQMALQIGLMVALTQLIGEHNVQLMGVIRVKVKVGFISLCVPFRVVDRYIMTRHCP